MRIQSREDLHRVGENVLHVLYNPIVLKINVGMASCGIAAGARATYDRLLNMSETEGFDVSPVGCIGFCEQEPLVDLQAPDMPRVMFSRVTEEKIEEVLKAYQTGKFESKLLLGRMTNPGSVIGEMVGFAPEKSRFKKNGIPDLEAIPFYSKQFKIALRNCGYIDPIQHRPVYCPGRLLRAVRVPWKERSPGNHRNDHRLGPERPWGRRFSYRKEVGYGSPCSGRTEKYHLQCRRRRSRGLHGQKRPGGGPAQRH